MHVCASSMHVCASSMHGVCLGDAWHGIVSTNWAKCVKHTPNDQNMVTKFNQWYSQKLELIWVQNNTKMSLKHFDKYLACNIALHEWAMHEHIEKYLNTSLKCHKGPTRIHTDQMGHSPIKILKTFCLKSKFLTPFLKNSQFYNPKLISA